MVLALVVIISGCASRQREVLLAQTVSDVRGCENLGEVELTASQIAIITASLGLKNDIEYRKDNCSDIGGNVIVGRKLCYYCKDLDTEYR